LISTPAILFTNRFPKVISQLIFECLSLSEQYYLSNQWDRIDLSLDELEDETMILQVLKWRVDKLPENRTLCSCASKRSFLSVFPWSSNPPCKWHLKTGSSAALHGHLEVLKWLKNQGCHLNSSTCSYAALNGHLDIVKWLYANGYKGE